jgi:hypothetical protein
MIHEDMNNHLTPEVLKGMNQVKASRIFGRVALFFVFVICVGSFIALTGCTTTANQVVESENCGNSVKNILCKTQM